LKIGSVLLAATVVVAIAGSARASGKEVFDSHCAVCHQVDGAGVPGAYPPLADSVGAYVRLPAGREYLVHVVSFGMTGAIPAHGQTYNGLMQPWSQFSDAQIAELLNYVLTGFNRKLLPPGFKPFTAAEVGKLRAKPEAFDQVHEERERLLKALAGAGGSAPKEPGS
jgi:mono/diheme cytochrome c family protein